MLTPYKIADYCKKYQPEWTCTMPDGCPPEEVLVPSEHPFFRLAKQANAYSEADFKTYAEADPLRHWGEHTPIPDVKLNNAENMRRLTLTNTLEYYDVPQILTAADATGTRYLCTLYEQTADGYHYLGVQISEPRLMAFIGGQLDLRDAYQHPEVDNALYVVEVSGEALNATTLLQPADLTEAMLPEAGYYYDAADLTDEADDATDTYQLEVPARDRITFSTLIARMGWPALSLRKTIGKVAVL